MWMFSELNQHWLVYIAKAISFETEKVTATWMNICLRQIECKHVFLLNVLHVSAKISVWQMFCVWSLIHEQCSLNIFHKEFSKTEISCGNVWVYSDEISKSIVISEFFSELMLSYSFFVCSRLFIFCLEVFSFYYLQMQSICLFRPAKLL